jgi:hypothetical protein
MFHVENIYIYIYISLSIYIHLTTIQSHHFTNQSTTTMMRNYALVLLSALSLASATCAPGYFVPEITNFELQLPYGSSPTDPLTISESGLAGCDGYQNATWFYWDASGDYIVMIAPPSDTDCAKTTNSLHCRTEFREDSPSSWSPTGTNTMTVNLAVAQADDGSHGTVIGQVFSAEFSKPVAELYYAQSGVIAIGVEQSSSGGDEIITQVGSVPQGTLFFYELSYSNDNLTVAINGGAAQSFPTSQLGNPDSYFKFGDYNQGTTVWSQVNVYSVVVVHE